MKKQQEFKHLMVDIETMGTKPGCAILSIAAVEFNLETGETGDEFEINIDLESSTFVELSIDEDTERWWAKQDQDLFKNLQLDARDIWESLLTFRGFCTRKDYQVWGNSARFDLGILEAAYDKFDEPVPWNVFNERDVRTLVSLALHIKKETPFKGIKHNPLDDCLHQIEYCHKTYRALLGTKS